MLVCCLGELMLDVLVETPRGLAADDDVPAAIQVRVGGQGANVAAWVAALGGQARLVGPRGRGAQGRLLADALAAAGVEPHLLRAADPGPLLQVADAARAAGTRVTVDLSSAALIKEYGAARFRRLCRALRPEVVFANDSEWAVCDLPGAPTVVRKHGAAGCTFAHDGREQRRPPCPGPVRDATGAGDALAAGFLLGGPELALRAAARCVAALGAQPEQPR